MNGFSVVLNDLKKVLPKQLDIRKLNSRFDQHEKRSDRGLEKRSTYNQDMFKCSTFLFYF